MMNEKTINEQYAYIRTLLEEKRLKEALMQLESLLWQCPDWDLRTRLEQLQTSYKYMLEYMKQGANDPERWNLYQKLVADTWSIADQSRLLMLDNASSKYYHEVRRTPEPADLAEYGLKKILHILESFNDDLAISGLLSDAKMDDVLQRHENTLKFMFVRTWTNSSWTSEDEEDAKSMLGSELLLPDDLCLFVSAVTLSVMGIGWCHIHLLHSQNPASLLPRTYQEGRPYGRNSFFPGRCCPYLPPNAVMSGNGED